MSFAKRENSGLCAFLRRGRNVPHALPFRPARKSCFLRLALIAALASPALLAARDVVAESGGDSLAPRIRFQAELPPWCESGWRGQGHGIVAVCRLNGRTQVRLIGGRVLPCARPDCADRQRIIKASLRRYR